VVLTRFGGDEFVAILPDVTTEAPAVELAERLIAALELPFVEQDLDIVVGASVGIALYPEHAIDAATLLQRADVAMYRAKGSRSGYEVYVAELDPFTPRRLALAGGLRDAIDRGEVEVLFQPQVELATGRVTGAEALVRWHHPSHGLLKPDEFIPAAEHNGSIKPLTRKVLAVSIAACREWRAQGYDLSVSVNLSMTSLLDTALPNVVRSLLDADLLPPEALVLELTEGSIMTESRRSLSVLTAIDEMGVRLSIDDFGTGYSSLSHLRRLPISEIKIDRMFIADLAVDEHDEAIVRTTIDLGHHLGLKVVAEGAESLESMRHLRDLGCDVAQGFVISRPRSQASFESWLAGQDVARLSPVAPATSLEQRRLRRHRAT
jgi:predicted signal transduction protein with EAL and GGDEF domain